MNLEYKPREAAEDLYRSDDKFLAAKLMTAQTVIENHLGPGSLANYSDYVFVKSEFFPAGEGKWVVTETFSDAPEPIQEAILRYAAFLYECREPVTLGEPVATLPHGIFEMLAPYRKWQF